jgi:hypothetical protein
MAINNRTYKPVQTVTITAAADLTAFRLVSHAGEHCDSGAKSMGAAEIDWLQGETAAVVTLGTISLETSGAVTAGDPVASDENGKAKTAAPGDAVNARALSSTSAAGYITAQLLP